MIRYALKCSGDHAFDSWFASAAAFDNLSAGGQVACPVCGATQVTKAVMAPRVSAKSPALAPDSDGEKALAALRDEVEKNADYVGSDFAREARDMHDGLTEKRSIYGEARPDEARALLEEGVPVLPLPFAPRRKVN